MDESDTVAILPAEVLNDVSSAEEQQESEKPAEEERREPGAPAGPSARLQVKCCGLPVSVEPVLFMSMFSLSLQLPLITQYLWDRISDDLGYNGTGRAACTNSSQPPDPLQEEVETLVAHWNMYISMAGFAVGLLVVPLLGPWSDLAGRRPVLIIPSLGLVLQVGIFLVVMYLKLPVVYFLLGRLFSGLTGDFTAILAACFAYVADVSDERSRTFRVAVLEACMGLAGVLAAIIGGYWRRAQGDINPFWLSLALSVAAALYSFLFVHESVQINPSAKLFTFRHYKAAWSLYWTGSRGHSAAAVKFPRLKLWLYTLCFFLVVGIHFGSKGVQVVYTLSSPLCWGPELIGWASAAQNVAILTSLVGLKVLQLCMKDSWVALLGLVSSITGLVVYSIADTTLLVFSSYALSFLFMATTPVIRSKLSKLVDPSEQGSLFASVACVESLCLLVGSSVFSALYPATLHFMKGFPFLLSAVILLIPVVIIGTLQCLDQRWRHRDAAAS